MALVLAKRPRAAKSMAMVPYTKKRKTEKAIVPLYRQPSSNVRLIKRNSDQGDIICTLGAPTFGAMIYRLSNAAGSGELTALFDSYKINAISTTFFPQQTEVSTHVTPAVQNVRIFTAIDYNDNNPPLSIDTLREYDNVEVHSVVQPFTVFISNPKFADTTGALRTGYINTSSPSTVHYGLKYAVEPLNPGATGTYTFRTETVYYFSLKNAK